MVPGIQTTPYEKDREHGRMYQSRERSKRTMARTQYSPQLKTKLVLDVLGGEKELGTIAYENNINPNMLRNWKREFLDHASEIFENPKRTEKQARRKEESLKKETDQMLKTIGQLTLERDFLQDCFRACGLPVPEFGAEK
jgi:transposase-like protein